MKYLFTCFLLLCLSALGPLCAEGAPMELASRSADSARAEPESSEEDAEGASDAGPETRKVDIKATAVKAKLNPQFEFVLPSGNINEHFVIYFNNLKMTFDLAYSIIDSSVDGEVTFAYPFGKFSPFVTFTQNVDFENLVKQELKGSELTLVPTEKYISRYRGAVIGVDYKPFSAFSIEPSFTAEDVFKGNLTNSIVIDEGVNLKPGLGFIFDTFQADLPGKRMYTGGTYFNSTFTMFFRNSFANPVNLKQHNLLLVHYYDSDKVWFIKERVSLNYPVVVWNKKLTGFYSIGGFDTLRGYSYASINAFRFLLISSEIEREILKEHTLKINLKKFEARVHQYRLFFLVDSLYTQDNLSVESDVNFFPAVGFGTGFNISGKSDTYFRVRLYTAQALGRKFAPILYFRTSLFNFETKN
jgi:hypothetical protein